MATRFEQIVDGWLLIHYHGNVVMGEWPRNARPEKALVGRAQLRADFFNQA